MKKLLIVIILFPVYFSSAQNISISAEKNNVFYIGVDNPVSILVTNYPSVQVIVKTPKGEVHGSGRIRIYRGFEPGNTSIILYENDGLTEIGRSNFRVKYIPDPVAKVGPSGGGKINKTVLRNQQYLRAVLEDFDYNVGFTIDSFTTHIIRTDTCLIKEFINVGAKFSNSLGESLNTIKRNDIVIFKNIYAKGPDGRTLLLAPIAFAIID